MKMLLIVMMLIFCAIVSAADLSLDTIRISGVKEEKDPAQIIEQSVQEGVANQARRYGEMIKKHKPSREKDMRYQGALKAKFDRQMDEVLDIDTSDVDDDSKKEPETVLESTQTGTNNFPAQTVVANTTSTGNRSQYERLQLMPMFGVVNISSGQSRYEAGPLWGFALGNQISPKWTALIKITHYQMKMTDVQEMSDDAIVSIPTTKIYRKSYRTFQSASQQTVDRKIEGKMTSVSVNSRYYLFNPEHKMKVFAGVGLGYNRTSLEYADLDTMTTDSLGRTARFKDVDANDFSFFSTTASFGTVFNLDETIHFELAIDYTKGVSGGASSVATLESNTSSVRLEEIKNALKRGSFTSIWGGVSISI